LKERGDTKKREKRREDNTTKEREKIPVCGFRRVKV
jgi:hypothetical protein